MMPNQRILIAGAGPVGLTAAACLVRRGIPVKVFEASAALTTESRATTFHPPTLDMLDDLGLAESLAQRGLIARRLQYRSGRDEVMATFDYSAIADSTRHPYRLQCEQFNLTRIIHDQLSGNPNYQIEFGTRVSGVSQDRTGVTVELSSFSSAPREERGSWLIGADGSHSAVRKALGIPFEGFTWPERFLIVDTSFDFHTALAGVESLTYVAAPMNWRFLLQLPSRWRVILPLARDLPDATATSRAFARTALSTLASGVDDGEIAHIALFKVHQRVAAAFRAGRVFLAGDAAHINNPLGGMGLNGGIHDAVNLAERLGEFCTRPAPDTDLDLYDLQRRAVAIEHVQKHSIRTKRNLETSDPDERDGFRDELRRTANDRQLTREFLRRVSMIASLDRAKELGVL
ncbi:FAD-dependent monooxygenase [Bradyrhizobium diazoefficiens]|uniref:FAD-dependent oxidoreductase n=1 Tax=Bradyrhizobium diazoefficiens TaxID=1355477 RepID=UPI00190BAC65|nr:NAD(P)/FAD-dependent oxidoreductase [Bradyrhizobium diazoefficiens]QQO13255.1 FAD-dependent monooxygenase [Bradyrhizobium diazoefficiens]QQO16847.1 FAD-dependent monooxygenase [Bradyrhizobium diazoefficiens]